MRVLLLCATLLGSENLVGLAALRGTWEPPIHAPGVTVVDFSDHDLPRLKVGGRVAEAPHGQFVDDIMRDTPDEMRPPALVAFHSAERSECQKAYDALNFETRVERELPARERLFAAEYDVDYAKRRAWYVFTPEMDLEKRYNVTHCPTLAFVPRKCDGFTEWCVESRDGPNSVAGCADFVEQCSGVVHWDGQGDWVAWAKGLIEKEGEPAISGFLGTYSEQGDWIQSRQRTTTMSYERNLYLSPAFPGFTKTGFKAVPTPKPVQDWLVGFLERHNRDRRLENWSAESTQMSFHEEPTHFVDMDRERSDANRIANTYIKPMVEEWSGMTDLELTSFYGIREYPEDAWLRGHIDRIDTHVLSVTLSIAKHEVDGTPTNVSERDPWPLQGIGYDGRIMRYDHQPGTMVLYESSKVVHGRPYRNKAGVHVAAFCHFKPTHSRDEMTDWNQVLKRARSNMNNRIQRVGFRQSPSEEPKSPKYTGVDYGHDAQGRWGKKSVGGKNKKSAGDGAFQATFINKSKKELTLYWKGPAGPVYQSTSGPGTRFSYTTYPGHKFFWHEGAAPSSDDKAKPMEGGSFSIQAGVSQYSSPDGGASKKSWSLF